MIMLIYTHIFALRINDFPCIRPSLWPAEFCKARFAQKKEAPMGTSFLKSANFHLLPARVLLDTGLGLFVTRVELHLAKRVRHHLVLAGLETVVGSRVGDEHHSAVRRARSGIERILEGRDLLFG